MLFDGITYTEFIGDNGLGQSPIEEFGYPDPPDIHSRSTRIFECAWSDRVAMVQLILGYGARTPGVGGAHFLSRDLPDYHPDWLIPWASLNYNALTGESPYVWANKVRIQGYGVDTTRPAGQSRMKSSVDSTVYKTARLTVEFVALPFFLLTDAQMSAAFYTDTSGNPDESKLVRYVTILPKGKARFMGLGQTAAASFKYAPNPAGFNLAGQAVQQAPGKIRPAWDLQIRHWRVPESCVQSETVNPVLLSPGAIDTTVGKVNSAAFAGMPAGSLLYLPPEFVRYIDPFGVPCFDICHFFEYVPYKHNYVPAFGTVTGDATAKLRDVEISTTGNTYSDNDTTAGVHIYDAGDFAPLFRAPA